MIKGLVCIWKLLEFQGSDFKALKIDEIGFWSFKFLIFYAKKKIWIINAFKGTEFLKWNVQMQTA